jgi:hypothetical protein
MKTITHDAVGRISLYIGDIIRQQHNILTSRGENLVQPRVVDPRDLMEDARPVHSVLGHQEMQVGVKIVVFLDAISSPEVFRT